MKDIPFDLAITSPLVRARRTAEIILRDRKVPILEDARIEEITFGVWEGLCCRGANYEIPSTEFSKFFEAPFSYLPPEGGESIAELIARCTDFYQELIATPEYQDKIILIASHGCACRALLYSLCEGKGEFWRSNVPPNCAVSIVTVEDGVSFLVELDKTYYNKEDIRNYYTSDINE